MHTTCTENPGNGLICRVMNFKFSLPSPYPWPLVLSAAKTALASSTLMLRGTLSVVSARLSTSALQKLISNSLWYASHGSFLALLTHFLYRNQNNAGYVGTSLSTQDLVGPYVIVVYKS